VDTAPLALPGGASISAHWFDPDGTERELVFQHTAPQQFAATLPAARQGRYLVEATVRAESDIVVSELRQALFVDYPDELKLQATNEPLLRAVASATGGVFDPEPAGVFATDGRTALRVTEYWSLLVTLALLLFVLDVCLRRLRF
jgi:hypothetical protein